MSYVIEYAKSSRSRCRNTKRSCPSEHRIIDKGELRLGSELPQFDGFAWRHWICTTDKVFENMRKSITRPEQITGFQNLEAEDQERIKRAWRLGYIPQNEKPTFSHTDVIPEEDKTLVEKQHEAATTNDSNNNGDEHDKDHDGAPSIIKAYHPAPGHQQVTDSPRQGAEYSTSNTEKLEKTESTTSSSSDKHKEKLKVVKTEDEDRGDKLEEKKQYAKKTQADGHRHKPDPQYHEKPGSDAADNSNERTGYSTSNKRRITTINATKHLENVQKTVLRKTPHPAKKRAPNKVPVDELVAANKKRKRGDHGSKKKPKTSN